MTVCDERSIRVSPAAPSALSYSRPQYELDRLVTRSIAGQQGILPIWHDVTRDEVMAQSPSLADKLARSTSEYAITEIAEEIGHRARPDLFNEDEEKPNEFI